MSFSTDSALPCKIPGYSCANYLLDYIYHYLEVFLCRLPELIHVEVRPGE